MSEPSISSHQASTADLLTTLFALGREVTSVLDLTELLRKIPELIARLTKFHAFAVYLLDPGRNELSIAYSVGYPDELARTWRLKVGQGLVGAAVAEGQPILVNDVHADPRYVEAVPGSNAELVVPLRRKGRVIGALNLLSDTPGQFTDTDEAILRQFGAHVAVAIENAKLFEKEREYTSTLETLSDVAREFGSILNLEELLTRIASLTRRVIDYRTFGILLLNEETQELEMKVAVRYGDTIDGSALFDVGSGLVGYAALHKEAVLVADVSADPRYIKVVDDARSELVIPLLLKDRCLGVFDLESPELDAFNKSHVEILTLLASQAAVAIENARLYQTIRRERGPSGEGDPLRAARAGSAVADRVAQAHEGCRCGGAVRPCPGARGRPVRLPDPRAEQPDRGCRRRVGKGRSRGSLQRVRRRARAVAHVPTTIHGRTFQSRRRARLDEHDPARAATRRLLLHAVLCALRLETPDGHDRELGTTVPDPVGVEGPSGCRPRPTPAEIELAGIPLGSFPGSSYDEAAFALSSGDLFVFFTDGVSEARDALGQEFGTVRLLRVIEESRDKTSRELVDTIFAAVQDFRGETTPNDDMTAVAIRITG